MIEQQVSLLNNKLKFSLNGSLTACLCLCFCCYAARLLKGRDSDGFPQYQEKFIRDCIRKFPYCEATLLQQLVRSIAPVEIVSGNTSDNLNVE